MEWPISWNDVKTRIEALERVAFPDLNGSVIKIGPSDQYLDADVDQYWEDGTIYPYYKVSDRVLTRSELEQCTLYINIDDAPEMSTELEVVGVSGGDIGIFIDSAKIIGDEMEMYSPLMSAIFVSNGSNVSSGTYVQFEYVLSWYENAFGAPGVTLTGLEIRLNGEG